MTFALVKFGEAITSPSTLCLFCSFLGLALLMLGRRRPGLVLLALSLAADLAAWTLPVDGWLLSPLEDRFPPLLAAPSHIDGIICLGGALDPELSEARGIPALNGAAERMTAFVALARRHPEARLAFTGGSGRVIRGHLTEADVARMLFAALGLDDRDIVYENQSRTTWENAVRLREMVHPRAGETWILITSAAHMPRSIGAFRSAGWPVIADPVAYKTAHSFASAFAASYPERLARIDTAGHEWAGLLAYRVFGRTDRLLPGPVRP